MRKISLHFIILIMIFCLFPQSLLAKTGYVSDMLLLTFRQGPGSSHAKIKTLISNTPVMILDEKNGYYKVELKSNEIGWVNKKFINFELPKPVLIDQLGREKNALERKITKLESTIDTLTNKTGLTKNEASQKILSLESSLESAVNERDELKAQLAEAPKKENLLSQKSRDIQKIIKENKTLQDKNAALSKNLDILTEKNKGLFKAGMIKWFLSGVGVLLLGWLIGHSMSSKKRKYSSLLD